MKSRDLYWVTTLAVLCQIFISDGYPQSSQWEQTNGPPGGHAYFVAVSPQGDIFAVTDDFSVFRSSNNGRTWKTIAHIIANNPPTAFVINDIGTLYLATFDTWIFQNRLYRSDDNGSNWSELNVGAGYRKINTIAFINTNEILLGLSGESDTSANLAHSIDSGNTWTVANTGIPEATVRTLTIHNNGSIFAGTSYGGVYRSTDNGYSWVAANNGLTALLSNY